MIIKARTLALLAVVIAASLGMAMAVLVVSIEGSLSWGAVIAASITASHSMGAIVLGLARMLKEEGSP